MSLWWIGPPAESLRLDDPRSPTCEQQIPRLIRSVSALSFVDVACGGGHVLALTRDGRLFGWGCNTHGQCGIGGSKTGPISAPKSIGRFYGRTVAAIACGAAHSVAMVLERPDDPGCVVYAWGAHAAGQLGHSPDVMAEAKMQASSGASNMYAVGGTFTYTAPCIVETLNGLCGRPADWDGKGGTLGVADKDGVRIRQPLSCGAAHTALVTSSGALYTFGRNTFGQCGREVVLNEVRAAVSLPDGSVLPGRVHALTSCVSGVACGGAHTLVVAQGKVYSFGLNATGQLGLGTSGHEPCPLPNVLKLPSSMIVVYVAAGDEFSACVTQRGEVLTFGFGGCGQLGFGNSGSMRVPRQVACDACEEVSCGGGQLYARSKVSGLLTWGYPGTWRQFQAQKVATAEAKHRKEEEQAGGGTVLTAPMSDAALPDWRPRTVPLLGDDYKKVIMAGQQVCPVYARRVIAGRHFGIVLGEPIEPMPEADAANLIKSTFLTKKTLEKEEAQRKEALAAGVITERGALFMAKRRIAGAQEAKERSNAATRVQAHQRRRLEQREAEQKRKKAADEAAEAARDKVVISATGKRAPTSKHLSMNYENPKPKPPTSKRVGGGFTGRGGAGAMGSPPTRSSTQAAVARPNSGPSLCR